MAPFVYPFDHPHDGLWAQVKALIGSKAANLGVMASKLGLPVPPAFTITTTVCNAYLAGGWPDGLDDEIREAMGGGRRSPVQRSRRSAARQRAIVRRSRCRG